MLSTFAQIAAGKQAEKELAEQLASAQQTATAAAAAAAEAQRSLTSELESARAAHDEALGRAM